MNRKNIKCFQKFIEVLLKIDMSPQSNAKLGDLYPFSFDSLSTKYFSHKFSLSSFLSDLQTSSNPYGFL